MNETEWLESVDPRLMLNHLRHVRRVAPAHRQFVWLPPCGSCLDGGGHRKLQLLSCAACRGVWDHLHDERSRAAVETSERFADARVGMDDLLRARRRATAAIREPSRDGAVLAEHASAPATESHNGRWVVLTVLQEASRLRASWSGREGHVRAWTCDLIRDIFGNPFRPAEVDPRWLTPDVVGLARSTYAERLLPSGELDPGRLAVLSDALMDAGCDDERIISHCRSAGPHPRGCWVLDHLLGYDEPLTERIRKRLEQSREATA